MSPAMLLARQERFRRYGVRSENQRTHAKRGLAETVHGITQEISAGWETLP